MKYRIMALEREINKGMEGYNDPVFASVVMYSYEGNFIIAPAMVSFYEFERRRANTHIDKWVEYKDIETDSDIVQLNKYIINGRSYNIVDRCYNEENDSTLIYVDYLIREVKICDDDQKERIDELIQEIKGKLEEVRDMLNAKLSEVREYNERVREHNSNIKWYHFKKKPLKPKMMNSIDFNIGKEYVYDFSGVM